eukprot:s2235_g18.t1
MRFDEDGHSTPFSYTWPAILVFLEDHRFKDPFNAPKLLAQRVDPSRHACVSPSFELNGARGCALDTVDTLGGEYRGTAPNRGCAANSRYGFARMRKKFPVAHCCGIKETSRWGGCDGDISGVVIFFNSYLAASTCGMATWPRGIELLKATLRNPCLQLDVTSFNSCMNRLNWPCALEVTSAMQDKQLRSDTITLNTLLAASPWPKAGGFLQMGLSAANRRLQ